MCAVCLAGRVADTYHCVIIHNQNAEFKSNLTLVNFNLKLSGKKYTGYVCTGDGSITTRIGLHS